MATYANNLRLKEIATGDESGTWGTSTNTNLSLIADALGYGTEQFAADANETFTMPDASSDGTRAFYLKFTSAVSLTATRTATLGPNSISKVWIIENATSGSQSIDISQGSGANVTIANGAVKVIYTDGAGAGAAVIDALTDLALTTPDLGTPSAATLTNATGLPISSGVSGLGANVATFLGTPTSSNLAGAVTDETGSGALVFGTSPALTTPAITTGINDANTNEIIKLTATGSAVNEVTVANAATGNNPAVSATGDDTNIGIDITPKGTGEAHVTASYFTANYSDKVNALGNTGTAKTITVTDGGLVTATLTGNCTFTLSTPNSISNRSSSFTMILTNDGTAGRTVAFAGGTFLYPGGAVSRTTDANAVDVWTFFTPNGGTNWYVNIPMKALS